MSPSSAGIVAAGQASGFNPKSVAGLVLWLSAQTISQADNTDLITWTDLSGLGNHGVSAGGAKYRTAQGPSGGPCVEYTSSLQSHTLPDLMNGKAAGEIFAVVRSTAGGSEHGFWKFGTNGANNHYPFADNTVYDDFGTSERKDAINVGAGASQITSWHRLNTWSANNDWAMHINEGAASRTDNTNAVAWNAAPKIGSHAAGGAYVAYSMILLYDRKLSTTDRNLLRAWQAANMTGGTP